MTQIEFLRKLKDKNIDKYTLVMQIIEEGKSLSRKSNVDKIKTFFSIHRKGPLDIIKDNLFKILESEEKHICWIIEALLNYPEFYKIISDNIIKIIGYLNKDSNINSTYDFLEQFSIKVPNGKNILEQNLKSIIQNTDPVRLFPSTRILKGISKEGDLLLNEKLEKNLDAISEAMLMQIETVLAYDEKKTNNQEFKSSCKENSQLVATILEELLESENKSPIDIEWVKDKGAYSRVYIIGQKVLKIGHPRATYKIPNHRRILQPELRIELKKHKYERFACVEVQDYVETPPKEIDREQLYQLYKELREDGIICADLRYDNVGRLLKDNKPNLCGEELHVEPYTAGLIGSANEVLKKGELVVIDLDHIYVLENEEKLPEMTLMAELFEDRYQEEKIYNEGITEPQPFSNQQDTIDNER